MRSFLLACIVAIVLAGIGAWGLSYMQESASVAFTSDGVRI